MEPIAKVLVSPSTPSRSDTASGWGDGLALLYGSITVGIWSLALEKF